jgi:replicative DNA helicase
LINSIETKFNLNGKLSGLETGLFDLDRITNGLQFSESSILAARPSIGKTALACNIVSHVCLKNKIPTLFISLEMSADALGRRILSCHQQVNMQSLRSGDLNQGDFDKCAKFTTKLTESPLFVHESLGGMSAGTAAGLIRKYAKRNGVKLVVIDYLQKMKADSKHEKRTYEIAESSGILTGAAKESGVALLLIAQLNREGEKDKGRLPRLSDLADSGQIERDADNVFLLHRKREEPNNASLIVAKQRDGETGLISLFFDGPHCQFQNAVVGPETKVSNDP